MMVPVFEYDIPQACAQEVSSSLNWPSFAAELQQAADKAEALRLFGRLLMETVIEAADRHKDRTGELIEEVARKTGVSFPHRAQRYIEHAVLCTRPEDRYSILKSNPRELRFALSTCTLVGGLPVGVPCHHLCLAAWQKACEKTGDRVSIEVAQWLPRDGTCEFVLRPG